MTTRDRATEAPPGNTRDGSDHGVRGRSLRSGILATLLSLLLLLLLAEGAVRSFWSLRYGVPFRDPGAILYAFYPELERVDRDEPTRSDEWFDVLILGGSVLHRGWSAVEQHLHERLANGGERRVRIFNLANPSHTSRDSRLKYDAIGEGRFELVVFYHGINDTRANNAPPGVFREDYRHYAWYDIVNAMAPFHRTATFALPLTLRWLAARAGSVLDAERRVPPDDPREDWMAYGKDIRSAASFSRNLTSILDRAVERADPVLLMTFATFVPDDYSLTSFRERRLGYGLHFTPIEMWGLPENVLGGVEAHNGVVRRLAREYGTMFVDQAALMDEIAYFNDVCHLTTVGSVKFADNMVEGMGGVDRLDALGGGSGDS